jgi:hypothetical protein
MATSAPDKAPPWFTAALAEYEAHRAEVLAEAQSQQQTLALGATAVGVVVAGGFNVWDDRVLVAAAFLAAVPLLSILVLVQWVGRAVGIMTVGVYLERLEEALRTASAPPDHVHVLVWEKTLEARPPGKWWKPSYLWTDLGGGGIFGLLALGSVGLGWYRAYPVHEALVSVLAATELVALLLFTVALLAAAASAREDARTQFRIPEDGDGASASAKRSPADT